MALARTKGQRNIGLGTVGRTLTPNGKKGNISISGHILICLIYPFWIWLNQQPIRITRPRNRIFPKGGSTEPCLVFYPMHERACCSGQKKYIKGSPAAVVFSFFYSTLPPSLSVFFPHLPSFFSSL